MLQLLSSCIRLLVHILKFNGKIVPNWNYQFWPFWPKCGPSPLGLFLFSLPLLTADTFPLPFSPSHSITLSLPLLPTPATKPTPASPSQASPPAKLCLKSLARPQAAMPSPTSPLHASARARTVPHEQLRRRLQRCTTTSLRASQPLRELSASRPGPGASPSCSPTPS